MGEDVDPIYYKHACAMRCFSSVANVMNHNNASAQKDILVGNKMCASVCKICSCS